MDPPPPQQPLSTTTTTHLGYPDSVESSPRSRNADSWDEPIPPVPGAKMRLMCSYGGHIVPKPHDKFLCYLGGDTRIIVVDRHSSLSDLSLRLSRSLLNGRSFTLKYQLPNEDLDSLISVTTDEDLENMIEEYDRTSSSSFKPSRLRLFLFPTRPESASSMGPILDDSKSENWFVDALNDAGFLSRGVSADGASVNCLLGLDDVVHVDSPVDVEAQNESLGNINKQFKHGQDVHSVPDSPMLENNSSFGSSSSSPSMANLPPIRVHVEDQMVGLEEHFSRMNVAATTHKQDDGFVVLSSPPPLPTTISAATGVPTATITSTTVVSENSNRILSDSERSEQGAPSGFRKPPQPPQKTSDGVDLTSPDGSKRDPNSRAKPMYYQDPSVQVTTRDGRVPVNLVDPKISDPSHRIQIQKQVQDSGYARNSQLDQHQQQQLQQQLQQQQQQQQLQLQQQQQRQQLQQQQQQQQQQHQQQQQFIHGGTHYIHHHPTGPVPLSSYYGMHPQQQQQLDQHYPMYFVPFPQTQPYNFSIQSSFSDNAPMSSSQTPTPNPNMLPTPTAYKESNAPGYSPRPAPPPKPEMAANVYRTTEQQNMGYMHHPSQSIAAAANYTYEFSDPTHAQVYYTQPLGATLPQYQTMNASAAVAASEASAQLPLGNTK